MRDNVDYLVVMRFSMTFYIAITTFFLVAATIMSALNIAFSWVFYTTLGGQILLLVMVYKILTDDYQTDKTFDHWYEDNPMDQD